MRRALLLSLTLAFGWLAGLASAQGLFAPAIEVNGAAITRYELAQREAMLKAFNTPGDLAELAREQLIEDRLKLQEFDRAGIRLTDQALRREMEGFAERANLTYPQFLQVLRQNGVAEETLRDFVRVGVTWRDYIRQKYGNRADISESDIDRTLGNRTSATTEIEVLLSEIIIPAPPPRAQAAMAEARRISQLTSQSAFESAARRVSALPSRARGGRLDWLPISNYPPALRPMLLGLARGEVTDPIPIPNGVALFQMRGVREVARAPQAPAQIEYLTFALPGGASEATYAEAARIRESVDRCDDFYGIARGLPAEQLQRQSVAPAQIPSDVAQVLAGLDANEVSWGPLRNGGQSLLMVMLCARVPGTPDGGEIDREAIGNQLLGQRLSGYADALLADLKANATIRQR
ncbi:MAG: peptidylprolyl isomerase [Proteobacteria bacterium]|nr:MAG: peptidylprolyl isomerase [Pseudomonadota bacterium]